MKGYFYSSEKYFVNILFEQLYDMFSDCYLESKFEEEYSFLIRTFFLYFIFFLSSISFQFNKGLLGSISRVGCCIPDSDFYLAV